MVVCPLCNHNQLQGNVCDECGKVLANAASPSAVPIAPLPDVLTTRFEPTAATEDDGLGFDDIEPTSEVRLPSYDIARAAELENTHLPGAALTAAAEVDFPELDSGRSGFLGTPTVLADQVLCRYCRNPQARSAVLCTACGMRLPPAPRPAAAAGKASVPAATRCQACGAPALSGQRCGDCGTEVRSP